MNGKFVAILMSILLIIPVSAFASSGNTLIDSLINQINLLIAQLNLLLAQYSLPPINPIQVSPITTTTTTTTTIPSGGNNVINSYGCNFGQIVCPSNYQYCTYRFTKYGNTYPSTIQCDMYTTKSNPGTLTSGQSLCPAYDNNKGYASSILCNLQGFGVNIPTTTTTTTQYTPTTTTTTSTSIHRGTILMEQKGCSLQSGIECPSQYSYCIFMVLDSSGNPIKSDLNCGGIRPYGLPRQFNGGTSLCGSYPSTGWGSSFMCKLIGYNTFTTQGNFVSEVVKDGWSGTYYDWHCPDTYVYCVLSTTTNKVDCPDDKLSGAYLPPVLPLILGPGQMMCKDSFGLNVEGTWLMNQHFILTGYYPI